MPRNVAFLFLGETLLIPHLYPIVEALARLDPALPIELWVSTSMHEALLGGWVRDLPDNAIRIRRAPGFRKVAVEAGQNPPLPPKLPTLLRLAPKLARTPVIVCAEQTSLWLPTLFPLRWRFIDTFHGAGSMMAKGHGRRRASWRTLVAAERDRLALIERGIDPGRIVTTGYVKAGFRHRTPAARLFAGEKPILLYTPHWQEHRSSWWRWGAEVVRRIADTGRYNLIFAPHQRLVERAPEVRALCDAFADRPDVHCDLDSFAMVDGSYTAMADLYLGDTSSQVVEFMMRPRPCVFLNALGAEWEGDSSYAMWRAGEVVDDPDDLLPALARAPERHPEFAEVQAAIVSGYLGDISGRGPERAAREIVAALGR